MTDLKISDSEALGILNVVSRSSKVDSAEGSHAVINGNSFLHDFLVIKFISCGNLYAKRDNLRFSMFYSESCSFTATKALDLIDILAILNY